VLRTHPGIQAVGVDRVPSPSRCAAGDPLPLPGRPRRAAQGPSNGPGGANKGPLVVCGACQRLYPFFDQQGKPRLCRGDRLRSRVPPRRRRGAARGVGGRGPPLGSPQQRAARSALGGVPAAAGNVRAPGGRWSGRALPCSVFWGSGAKAPSIRPPLGGLLLMALGPVFVKRFLVKETRALLRVWITRQNSRQCWVSKQAQWVM
jgi:hypothetical protein